MRAAKMDTSQDRPREKLLRQGAHKLSNDELLAILLKTGLPGLPVQQLSRQLLSQAGSLRGLFNASRTSICQLQGVGAVRYTMFQAVLELARRYFLEEVEGRRGFTNVAETREFLVVQLRNERQERFAMLCLDSQHQLISFDILFYGTINSASVYPRVVLENALERGAAAVIFAHNHPSGCAEPSQADLVITRQLTETLSLVDINVLDHFIVAGNELISFAERGLL